MQFFSGHNSKWAAQARRRGQILNTWSKDGREWEKKKYPSVCFVFPEGWSDSELGRRPNSAACSFRFCQQVRPAPPPPSSCNLGHQNSQIPLAQGTWGETTRGKLNYFDVNFFFLFFFLAVRGGHTSIMPPLRTRAEDQLRSRFSQQKSLNVGRLAQWLRGFWRMMKEHQHQIKFIMIRRNNVGAQLSSSSLLAENNNVRLGLLGRFCHVTQSLWDSPDTLGGGQGFWWRTHWLGPSEHWHFKIKLINK